jgi:hypothetical protein
MKHLLNLALGRRSRRFLRAVFSTALRTIDRHSFLADVPAAAIVGESPPGRA